MAFTSERNISVNESLTLPLKWHGGKQYLARRIIALMPRHLHYVEPFAGGLAVLLERDPNDPALWLSQATGQSGVSEVVNDLSGNLVNFWRVLRDRDSFGEFVRRCQATALSRSEWERAGDILEDAPHWNGLIQVPGESLSREIVHAWAFFVRCRQSRAGTFKGFTSLTRSRTRRGINGNASEWLGAVEGLPAVHARLQPVVVENMDAIKLIRREDAPGTLFYCDPPYLHETRAKGSTDAYAHEMTETHHFDLLKVLAGIKGKFLLSGYRNPMYDGDAERFGWRRVDFEIANHAAGGKEKRRMVESVWKNFD